MGCQYVAWDTTGYAVAAKTRQKRIKACAVRPAGGDVLARPAYLPQEPFCALDKAFASKDVLDVPYCLFSPYHAFGA